MAIRSVKGLVKAKPTLDGASVHSHRAFGTFLRADAQR
jgi:hypothetical protein